MVERQLPEKVLTFVDTSLSIIDNFNFSNYFWPDSLVLISDSGEMNYQILANISFNTNDNPSTNYTFHSREMMNM